MILGQVLQVSLPCCCVKSMSDRYSLRTRSGNPSCLNLAIGLGSTSMFPKSFHIYPVDIIHGAGLIIIIALPSISISFGYYDISMLCFHNIKREPNNKISLRPNSNSKTNSSKQKAWLRKLQSVLEVCIIDKEYILY